MRHCRSQRSMRTPGGTHRFLACAPSEASSRRLCHILSLAEGGLSGSGSVRGQAKTSVPAGDHKKYTITLIPIKPSAGGGGNQEAFQLSLPSPPLQATRNCPTHSLSVLSPPPQWVGLGWGVGHSCIFDTATPLEKLHVVKVAVIMREQPTPAASELRHGETQHSGGKKKKKKADNHDSGSTKAAADVLVKVTIFP